MNKIVAVAPADLATVWPLIREELDTVEKPDGFISEDVYAMCKTGNAAFFFLEVDDKRAGWMVLRLMQPDLHIWMVRADNGYDVMTTFRPQLMEMARGANAQKLTFGSTRKAWAKVASEHGFKMRMIVYEINVEPPPVPAMPPVNDASMNGGGADNDQNATH
jgi:hypothetical protein